MRYGWVMSRMIRRVRRRAEAYDEEADNNKIRRRGVVNR